MKLILFQPLNNFKTYNHFGENTACSFPDKTGIVGTIDGICAPGKVLFYPLIGLPNGHNGEDCIASMGTQIYASHSGYIQALETNPTMGLAVYLVSNDQFEFAGQVSYARTVYLHMSGYNVVKGQKISVGDLLGWSGNTGASGGEHLHLGLAPCTSDGVKLYQNNGFGGYIDLLPYMAQTPASSVKPLLLRLIEIMARISDSVAENLRKLI